MTKDEEDPLAWYDPLRMPREPSASTIPKTVYVNACSYCKARLPEFHCRYKTDKYEAYVDGDLCRVCISVLNNAADKDVIVGKPLASE